ncbi:GTPase HflX [Paenibacillaceae bacterium]|nr:GTPase HflX [Paenibacillaceae bacterium]
MMEPQQRAIIVGVHLQQQELAEFTEGMKELQNLAAACDIETVGELTQKLSRAHSSSYIGPGKIQELNALVAGCDADAAVFYDELSPSQIRNLEAELDCRVIDRTMLILDIFASRAKTRESQLQVEVARMQYMLPRLVGLRASLGRQGGGSGLANRGAGETKLELDRRKIEDRIVAMNRELDVIFTQRETRRSRRRKQGIPVVTLIGYTNAGKSTFMNAMLDCYSSDGSHKKVMEKDMLFATLETSVRQIRLDDQKSFLLTDTVGFVNKLPHHLIKAFRSTLEEAADADLILHIVDYSQPNYEQLMNVTNQTVREIGVADVPTITVYNKIDLVDGERPALQADEVCISAHQRLGLEQLIDKIRDQLFHGYTQCEMMIPYDQGHIVSYLNDHAVVQSAAYEYEGTKLIVECKQSDREKFREYVL